MPQLSRIISITSKTPPHVCGVGDYTINLVTHCKQQLGQDIHLIVGTNCNSQSEPIAIHPIVENWSSSNLSTLLTQLQTANVHTVLLQYTGFSYSLRGFNLNLISFWQQCARHFQTLLIVHETYNRWALKYPGTWTLNPLQKYVLHRLVRFSHHVFCGSKTYLQQIKQLSHQPAKLHHLPIPNNIPPLPFSALQRQNLLHHLGIAPDQIILTLFGCRVAIYQDWLMAIDRDLKAAGYSITWMLLGDAQKINLPLQFPVIRPGFLNPVDLSHHLQLSDLLLMPHELGISAKRTSLMAALEHGIPVIGTQGYLTDSFFSHLPSLKLSPDRDYHSFASQVLQALNHLPDLKQATQTTQAYYQDHLSWAVVTQTLQPYLQTS